MRVVDASAVVHALAADDRSKALLDDLLDDGDLHAPHIVDVEVTHALRGLVARGRLSVDRAEDARLDLSQMPISLYPHALLLDRAWHLRHDFSVYDAMYVALAEALSAPLVTCDRRLGRRATAHVTVELFAAS